MGVCERSEARPKLSATQIVCKQRVLLAAAQKPRLLEIKLSRREGLREGIRGPNFCTWRLVHPTAPPSIRSLHSMCSRSK